jgi:hypothetical protein
MLKNEIPAMAMSEAAPMTFMAALASIGISWLSLLIVTAPQIAPAINPPR